MNLKFISRTFDLISKEEYSEPFIIKSESEVIIKVNKIFSHANSFRQGIGEIVAAGKDYIKLIRKKVEFLLPSDQTTLKEYEICDGKYCVLTYGSVLMQAALTSLMLLEYVKKYNPQYLIHVSGCKEVLMFLEYFCEGLQINLINVSSPVNSGVLSILKYDMLLVGDLSQDMFFEEKTPRNSIVVQYSTNCTGRILHQGTYIKESVFDWYSKLSYLKKKQLFYYIEFQEKVFLNTLNKVKFEDFLSKDFCGLVELDVGEVFSKDFIKNIRKFSIDTQRLSGSGLLSMTCSVIENTPNESRKSFNQIEEILNIDCLNSPRIQNNEELLDVDYEVNCYSHFNGNDETLIKHLKKMIGKYSDPNITKIINDLNVFFQSSDCENPGFIKLIEEDLSIYEGEMNENRQPAGFGCRYFMDGTVFKGFWKEGRASGKGIMACVDGMLYVGEWKNGVFHGYGSLNLPDRSFREGNFYKGELNGVGIEILSNGEKYHGNFLNDLRHDKGRLVGVDGQTLLVKYYQGVLVEQRRSFSEGVENGVRNSSWNYGDFIVVVKDSNQNVLEHIGEYSDADSEYCDSDSNSDSD